MLNKIAIAGAALIALTASSYAAVNPRITSEEKTETARPATHPMWVVLQDAGGTDCYVSDQKPSFDVGQLTGTFGSEQQAEAALKTIPACEGVNTEHDKE